MTDDFAQAYEDKFAASVIVNAPPQAQPAMAVPSETETPQPVQPTGPEVTEKQLLLDPKFAASARDIHLLFEGEPFDGDDQAAARYGIDVIGEFNYNFAGPVGIPGEAGVSSPGTIGQAAALLTSGSQDQAKAFVYLMDRYDQLPNFTLAGTGRMIRGMVADPSIYTGFGTLGLGFAARKTGAVGIKKALVEIAKRPGTSAAVYTGVEAGAADQLTQAVEEQAGYEIDPVTGALRTAITSVVGGAAGGGLVKGGEMLAREFGPAVGEAISQAGQSAEARMAERSEGVTLGMGADPMEVIDPALAAAGKLVRGKDSVEELRRQANIERFGYDPKEQAPDTSYRMQHQPRGPEDDLPVRLDNLTKSTTGEQAGYPDDFYTSEGQRIYAPAKRFADDEFGIANTQSYNAIRKVKGKPNATVTIYRGVPNDPKIDKINRGDFVTLSPKYAELHAASGYGRDGDEPGKVISMKVKVKDIYWDGNDVNEFGYFPNNEDK